MVVLKELIMNSWYFGRLCGPERTDFEQFLHWDSVEVLKELILTVDTLRWCGGLKVTDF